MLIERKSMAYAVALGLTIGAGLLAKYAMIYFPLCMACQAMFSAEARGALRSRRTLVILFIAFVVIAPNLYWNYAHGFVTFQHTAHGSAGWGRHIGHFWQFMLSQFGVYGPVLFFMLLWITALSVRDRTDRRVVMLLAFSRPYSFATVRRLTRARIELDRALAPAASILVTALLEPGVTPVWGNGVDECSATAGC